MLLPLIPPGAHLTKITDPSSSSFRDVPVSVTCCVSPERCDRVHQSETMIVTDAALQSADGACGPADAGEKLCA